MLHGLQPATSRKSGFGTKLKRRTEASACRFPFGLADGTISRVPLLRSSRLESIFGGSIDGNLASAAIHRLVDDRVTEAFDLDFKSSLYGNRDADRRDLAGDVCALANTGGGVLVLGVEENNQAVAAAAPGVALTDAELQRMHLIIGSLCAPMPRFEIVSITDGSPDHGYYLITVPRSAAGPHALLVNDGFRYPRRNGSTTRYLSEPEVAAAYRDRFAGLAQRSDRLSNVEVEGRAGLSGSGPWLTVCLMPELPGSMTINQRSVANLSAEVRGRSALLFHDTQWQRVRAARRRLVVDSTTDPVEAAQWASLELHSDGAGFYAYQLHTLNASGDEHNYEPRLVSEEELTLALVAGLRHLGTHARDRAGASGDALLSATLAMPHGTFGASVQLGNTRDSGSSRRTGPVTVQRDAPAEATASVEDLAEIGGPLLLAARALASEIGQAFGLPESVQIDDAGKFVLRHWNSGWRAMVAPWARSNNLEIDET